MSTVEKEVKDAIEELQLSRERIWQCDSETARNVVRLVMDSFVDDNPRAWWEGFRYPTNAFSYPDGNGYKQLVEHVPEICFRCWFSRTIRWRHAC